VELFIFLLTLATLFFEALFIFMPANRSINRKTRELMAEKEYSEMIIESSANAIIAIDKTRKVQTFNKMAETIFGYQKHEMVGKDSLKKIIPAKWYEAHVKGLKRFFEAGVLKHRGEAMEAEAVDRWGRVFPVRIYFGRTGEKENVAVVASIQDISKEKLRDSIVQQQAKLAALGEMIAIIAHQWRQPLAQLNFNCIYIRKQLSDESLKKEINKNEEIIAFMSETISSFEDFYRETEKEWFFPSQSVKQALRLIESLISLNRIELVESYNETFKLYGRVNSLAQVVLSILQNMVDVIRQREVASPRITIRVEPDGKGAMRMVLEDNAGGIKVEPIEEIFEPFKSRKKRPSTGIGLYMARMIVEEKFGGSIKASNTAVGARFCIWLPVSDQSMV
jgi:PAS domain S-box-containing protein